MASQQTDFPEVISFRARPEMAEQIRRAAKQDRRRVSDWIRLYLEDHMSESPRCREASASTATP